MKIEAGKMANEISHMAEKMNHKSICGIKNACDHSIPLFKCEHDNGAQHFSTLDATHAHFSPSSFYVLSLCFCFARQMQTQQTQQTRQMYEQMNCWDQRTKFSYCVLCRMEKIYIYRMDENKHSNLNHASCPRAHSVHRVRLVRSIKKNREVSVCRVRAL